MSDIVIFRDRYPIIIGQMDEEITFTRCTSADNCKEYKKKLQDLDESEKQLLIAEHIKNLEKKKSARKLFKELFDEIKHGDQDHQDWLENKMEQFLKDRNL